MSIEDPNESEKKEGAKIRNRRLQYLRLHPDEPIIGGRISANLLAAYDLDQRIEARKESEKRALNDEEETSSEESIEDRESATKRARVEDFLDGKDKEFEYSKVDNDISLDETDTRARDLEEEYFAQSPDENGVAGDTGIQDF